MKLGEKLQRLRRQSGLSQEQLAARLAVSRQAVSKWELDETMPDTENVIQLSRIFGVSCDYLLLDEMDGQGAAPVSVTEDRHLPGIVIRPSGERLIRWPSGHPANDRSGGAGAARLDEQGWTRSATVLSLGLCAIGLLLALGGWLHYTQFSELFIIASVIVQVLGLVLFELAGSRMGNGRALARLDFYRLACWLVFPVLISMLHWWAFWEGRAVWLSFGELFMMDLLMGGLTSGVLLVLRRRQAAKK